MKKVNVVNIVEERPQEDVETLIKSLKAINTQKAELEKREKELKGILNERFEDVDKDTFGNRYLTADGIILKREMRRKVAINPEKAEKFFKSINRYDNVAKVETVVTFDEGAIEQVIADGEMTLEDLESITDTTVSYATLFVKKKEKEDDLDESN